MSTESDRLFDPGRFDAGKPTVTSRSSTERRGPEPGDRIIRVLPDVSGLERQFDYLCPARWADEITVGSLIRFDLNRRRVAGWVTDIDVTPSEVDVDDLAAITKVSSVGPPAEVVDLARWAARRWHGRLAAVLRAASPPRMVRTRPRPRTAQRTIKQQDSGVTGQADDWLVAAAVGSEAAAVTTCLEVGPGTDMMPMLEALYRLGDCLVIIPDLRRAGRLAAALGRRGVRVHLQPSQWSGGFTGGMVIGARSAVWAPVAELRSVVVLDEHDESLQEERVPTWHARDVAIERARRAGARCLLVSPVPSLAARHVADRLIRAPRTEQRRAWPITEVIDRRRDELGFSNLFSSRLIEIVRMAETAVVVLNRKGRARLLACRSCGELVRTEDGGQVMIEDEGGLVAPATGERRPLICANCAGTALKRLQLGVGRAAEQLQRLLGRPVAELTGTGPARDRGIAGVILGTEAALHAVDRCDVVAFLDFDQELLAPRYRAGEQAVALTALAARLLGGRESHGRLVIQTRVPDHRVVNAVVAGDPERFAEAEAELRAELGFPPHGALAEVSGAGADDYAAAVAAVTDTDPERWAGVRLLGPRRDDRYLVSVPAETVDEPWELMADLLTAVPRPRQRVRIAVDPPRS